MYSTSVSSDLEQSNEQSLIAKANCCRILADCFWEPRLPDIAAWSLLSESAQLMDDEVTVALVAEAQSEAGKLDPDQLPILYSKLFLGPFEVVAPPYASIYLDQEEAFAGRTQTEVLAIYSKGGLQLPPLAGETPDHISVELEFLYFLLVKAIQEAEGDYLEQAQQFTTSHLLEWLPGFLAQLELAPEARFYCCLVKMIQNFS